MTTTSALATQTGANMAATDLVPTVDVSDTTMSASGTSKASTLVEFMRGGIGAGFTQRNLVANFGVYNPGDIVVLTDGREVMIKTACTAGSTGFISAANFVLLMPQFYIFASAYGVVFDASQTSATANTAALQAAINAANPTFANGAGGIVILGKGQFYTNAFIQIQNGVTLAGNSTFGTYWSLADSSNCSMVGPHVSTGAGNANAFYWGLRDMSLDCRQAQQGAVISDVTMTATSTTITSAARNWINGEHVVGSGILPDTTIVSGGGTLTGVLSQAAQQTLSSATVYCGVTTPMYGVHCNVNPLTSQQSGDWAFDPSGFISNVVVKNARDAGFANFGRSANVYLRCKTSVSLGCGFIGSFDSRYISCEADFPAWHGFDFRGSSQQITDCKSYNCGQVKTTAAAASNHAHGYKVNFYTYIAISACDAQQTTGNGFHLEAGATGISIAGCTAAVVGYTSTGAIAVGFHLDNAQGCTIVASMSGITGISAVRLIGGSDKNTIIVSHGGTSLGLPVIAGSALLNNTVIINGTAIQIPGTVSSATLDSAYAKRYSIVTTNGSNHNIGMLTTQATAVLNRLELVPFFPERGANQTITQLTFRVGTGNVATAVLRQGIYSSNKTGGNVFTLEQELPATVDCSATGTFHTTAFTTPITVDPAKMYWVGSVPQVALAAFQTNMGDFLAGSTVNPTGGYCFTSNGVSGALPATITFSTTTAPVHLSTGIGVGVTLTG